MPATYIVIKLVARARLGVWERVMFKQIPKLLLEGFEQICNELRKKLIKMTLDFI
jgi:hypothetical protein